MVWKYLFSVLFMVAVLAIFGGIIFALQTKLLPALQPSLDKAAGPVTNVLSALVGLSALFTCYRIASWLPAVATGDRDYSLASAWRATRWHRLRYLGFTFWLLFSLVIAGVIGAGAFFGQKMLANTYVTMGAFALIGVLSWLALFLMLSVPASHYRYLASPRAPEPPPAPEPEKSA